MLGDATRFSLPFQAWPWSVGLSTAGKAYVCEKGGRTVLAFQLSGSGQWTELWRRDLPDDIHSDIRRYPYIAASTPSIFTHLCLLQDNSISPTVAMDGGDKVSRTRREGIVLTCINHQTVYQRKREDERGYEIVLWYGNWGEDEDEGEVILRPPPDKKWSGALSVCGSGRRVAVVEGDDESHNPSTLDIFHQHKHAARVKLGYRAGLYSAVCCSPSHVFVPEFVSLAVHIYTWDGEHRQTVRLQGREGGDMIWGIQYIPQHRQLVAAVGPQGYGTVTGLLSTKVNLQYSRKKDSDANNDTGIA